ncbi:MAG: glycosyltransferase family 4 protein [Actinomycetes bacterium]
MISALGQAGEVELISVDRHSVGSARVEPPAVSGLGKVSTLTAGPETTMRDWLRPWVRGGPPRRLMAMDTSELTEAVLRRLESSPDIDLVFYSLLDTWWPVHEAIKNSRTATRSNGHTGPVEVVDFNDLENLSLKLRRRNPPRFAPGSGPTDRVRVLSRWGVSRAFDLIDEPRWDAMQRNCAAQVAAVGVCSELDVERSGCPNAFVVGNGAQAPERIITDRSALQTAIPTMLFVGALDYEPNSDAVEWFVREVMPQILAKVPAARLRIVGRNPERVSWVRSQPGVDLLGLVDDLAPELESADVSIVPIRVGAGTRLKVVEALAHCIPLVTTSVGCEGIAVQHNIDALVADNAAEFATACVSLLSEGDLRQRLSQAGEELFRRQYEWSRIEADLAAQVTSWVEQAQA